MSKQDKLATLRDKEGRYFLLAIDQRGSLRKMLGERLKVDPHAVASEHLVKAKQLIIKILSSFTTGVLTDPQYGYPIITKSLKKGRGFLLATEESGGTKSMVNGQEEVRTKLSNWTPERISRTGAAGVKLLVPYNSQASEETKQFQKNVVTSVGQQCVIAAMPFVLELLSYPETTKETVLEAAAEFTKDQYHVDILKLEYPGSLDACREITASVTKPWIMLSAGVPFEKFYKEMKNGFVGGAAGYLVGRAVWQDAIPFYDPKDKKLAKMKKWLEKTGVKRLQMLQELSTQETP